MARFTVLLVLIGFSLQSFGAVSAISRLPANIVGQTDDRGMVRAIGYQYFSPVEIKQIRNNVGYVYCPGNKLQKVRKGERVSDSYLGEILVTGFLVEKDVLVTVAHAFANMHGTMRPLLSQCYFQTQGDNPKRYYIKADTLRHGFRWQSPELNDDYAVVKLITPVENAQKLTILNPPAPLRIDTSVYPIISNRPNNERDGGRDEDLPHEPLVQECKIKKLLAGSVSRPSSFYTDCDGETGGSGGPNLVRVEGQLVVTGIFTRSGFPEFNYKNYSEALLTAGNGVTGQSLSISLHIDSVFLRDVEDLIRQSKSAALNAPIIGSAVPGAKSVAPSQTSVRGNFSGGFVR